MHKTPRSITAKQERKPNESQGMNGNPTKKKVRDEATDATHNTFRSTAAKREQKADKSQSKNRNPMRDKVRDEATGVMHKTSDDAR